MLSIVIFLARFRIPILSPKTRHSTKTSSPYRYVACSAIYVLRMYQNINESPSERAKIQRALSQSNVISTSRTTPQHSTHFQHHTSTQSSFSATNFMSQPQYPSGTHTLYSSSSNTPSRSRSNSVSLPSLNALGGMNNLGNMTSMATLGNISSLTAIPTDLRHADQMDRMVPSGELQRGTFRDTMNGFRGHAPDGTNRGDFELHPDDVDRETISLAQSLFNNDAANSQILAFKTKAPRPTQFQNNMKVVYSQNKTGINAPIKRQFRHINPTPERVLDAPDFSDDYYLNLLDWSSQNKVAIALGAAIYLWDPQSGEIEFLLDLAEAVVGRTPSAEESATVASQVTSVSFMPDGSHIAVGTNNGETQLWNIEKKRQVRTLKGHAARVSSLAWNSHTLTTGSLDTNIINHDVRVKDHMTDKLEGHEQEVCGLKWSPDGSQLASGGNDNKCMVWDAGKYTTPRHVFGASEAAVKALAWCPWQSNTLATGSGTADRKIRFYDTSTGAMTNQIDTQSQVCSLVWSTTEKEILSSHGFSQNQLSVWKYPSLVKVADLTGHTSRVLQTAISPDGTTVASAAADETLRFWRVWESREQKMARKRAQATADSESVVGKNMMMNMNLR